MEITIEDEKSVNSSIANRGTISMYKKNQSSKKICFTPTQASETSEHYYDLDEKAIPSFDTVVHKTESLKINDDLRRSSPIKTENAYDFYDECCDLVNYIKNGQRKGSVANKSYSEGVPSNLRKRRSIVINKESSNDNANVKEMTNIQEINNFHDYTRLCMEIIAKMEIPDENTLTKQFVFLPFENQIGFGKGKKRLAIFDLDETLIHCELKDIESAQKKIKIKMTASIEKTIGLNIRPNFEKSILKIKEKYHVIMFTASLQKYADAVMDEIDPTGSLFEYRLYRNNCTQIKVDNQIYYIKDLRVFKNISLDDIVIIDNSVLSFAFHLDNGIPILPYYRGNDEIEMKSLVKLMDNLADVPQIKTKLRSLMKLYKFIENLKKKENLEPIEEIENINGSFIDQN